MSDMYVYGSIVITCLIVIGLIVWLLRLHGEYERIRKNSHHSSAFLNNHAQRWFWFSLAAGFGALISLLPVVLITFALDSVVIVALAFPLLCFLMMRFATRVYNNCKARAEDRRAAELRFG